MQVLIFIMLTFVTTVHLQPTHGARRDINLFNRGVSTKRNDVMPCTVGSYFSILDGCKRELVENDNSLAAIKDDVLIKSLKKEFVKDLFKRMARKTLEKRLIMNALKRHLRQISSSN